MAATFLWLQHLHSVPMRATMGDQLAHVGSSHLKKKRPGPSTLKDPLSMSSCVGCAVGYIFKPPLNSDGSGKSTFAVIKETTSSCECILLLSPGMYRLTKLVQAKSLDGRQVWPCWIHDCTTFSTAGVIAFCKSAKVFWQSSRVTSFCAEHLPNSMRSPV